MGHEVFDQWVEVYEWMVDWPRRLEREGPMFRRLFEQTGVRRVVDVACGPGYHAAMFHRWGLEVEGADLSEAMIQRAIALHGQPPGLRWTVRPFQAPVPNPGYFDAAVCIGNSLALAEDKQMAAEAVRQMFRAVRPGGLVFIQVLNLWALPEGKLCWQKCLAAPIGGKPQLILKAAHRVGQQVVVDLLLVDLDHLGQAGPAGSQPVGQSKSSHARLPIPEEGLSAQQSVLPNFPSGRASSLGEVLPSPPAALPTCPPGGPSAIGDVWSALPGAVSPAGCAVSLPWQAQSELLLGFSAEELQQMAHQAGASRVLLYGGYPDQPYLPSTSQDLILVAWQAENSVAPSSGTGSARV